jgi:hypothetical protein
VEFIDKFFNLYARSVAKPRWAEKSPRNVQALGLILRHFPNARFILVIRDGRDVACSLRTFPKYATVGDRSTRLATRKPIEQCIERWINDVHAGLAFSSDSRVITVRYEDLVSDTERTLRQLLQFLDEPWSDEVLKFHEIKSPSRDAAHFLQNPEAQLPIYPSAIGRWKVDLSKEELAHIESVAGDLLHQLGYLGPDHQEASLTNA